MQLIPDAQAAAYRDKFLLKRQSTQMDYPAHVHLETLAKCNAACSFCPYPVLERQGERMDTALIEKVVRDLEDIPRAHPFQLSPFKVNEPFLDVRLFDLLALFNERLPNATLTLTTNASPLTARHLEQLREVKRLGYLWVSLNEYRKAEYEAEMQLPFERTFERLKAMHDAKQAGRLDTRVVLSRVGDGSVHDLNFRAWVAKVFPLFSSSVFRRGGWLGQVETDAAQAPDLPCNRWFELSITATGVVAHCCMDGQARYPIGDVRTQHVLEIYNAPEYRRLREATMSRREVSPCSGCGFL